MILARQVAGEGRVLLVHAAVYVREVPAQTALRHPGAVHALIRSTLARRDM